MHVMNNLDRTYTVNVCNYCDQINLPGFACSLESYESPSM